MELSSHDESKRREFNKLLKDNEFVKDDNISTTWHVKFKEEKLISAHNFLNNFFQRAKEKFELNKINYAYQISINDVKTKSI